MLPGFQIRPQRRPRRADTGGALPSGAPSGVPTAAQQPTTVAPPGPMVSGTVAGGIKKGPAPANPVTSAQSPAAGITPPTPGTTYTPPTPPPAAAPPPTSIDQLAEDFSRKQIEAGLGPVDTSEREKLIRELEQQQLGASLVGNRASMGRAGFASSGALQAMQGDTMRMAAQQAAGDILGVRERAQQQAIDNAQAAMGLDIQERAAANQKTELDARLAALQHLLDPTGESSPPPADPGAPDVGGAIGDATGINSGTSPLGKGTDQTELATSADNPAGAAENPNDPNLPRKSSRQSPSDQEMMSTPTYTVYKGADGHLYRVDK